MGKHLQIRFSDDLFIDHNIADTQQLLERASNPFLSDWISNVFGKLFTAGSRD